MDEYIKEQFEEYYEMDGAKDSAYLLRGAVGNIEDAWPHFLRNSKKQLTWQYT